MNPALLMTDVRFSYGGKGGSIAIDHFEVAPGESIFLYGPSGIGKSTMLGLAAGTLTPSTGTISVLGHEFSALSPGARDRVRADSLGIVFQLFNLIPYLSVTDNVLLPCRFSPARRKRVQGEGSLGRVASSLLSRLGLEGDDLQKRSVAELSVGQQQRVAAARALIGAPGLIIADEPTSALDADTQSHFLDLLLAEAERTGAAVIFVSHNRELAPHFERQVAFEDLLPRQGEAA